RLTGSGLSIMRWAPLTGALPPLNHADWEHLYALYQRIPQYALEHRGFGLAGFEGIFWLEWVHRLWGRLIGLAVIVPLVIFWWQGRITRWLGARLLLFFVLGAVQGLVGWLMVSSGFRADSTAVAAPWLVFHLVFALALYAAILWTALVLITPDAPRLRGARPLFRLTSAACILVAFTIAAGGLTAGTHAGFVYNTFPLMEGHLVPGNYARLQPFLANLTRNTAAVQFDHRLLATLTLLVTIAAALVALAQRHLLTRAVKLAFAALALVVLLQYALGVVTLLLVVPLPLGVAHQLNATLLLTASLVALSTLRGRTA
ncbi:MAG: COX15/CtaA family protein, partial [Terriglobales bacterium]